MTPERGSRYRDPVVGQSLLNLFEAAQSSSIEWNGKTVRRWYRKTLAVETTVRVEVLRSVEDPVQALAFAITRGEIHAGSFAPSRRVILWRKRLRRLC
jgi:hypothetical protein